MEGPVKLLQRVRKRVQAVTYGSPIYRLMLDQGPVPDRIRLKISDPWPGNAAAGHRIAAGGATLFEMDCAEGTKKSFLTHDVLRDLRATGSQTARCKAVDLIDEWLDGQGVWDEESWAPEVLGARLANWISFYDFFMPAAPPGFENGLIIGMVRQLRHLIHAAPAALPGAEGLSVIKGLVYGGLGLIEGERALGLGLELLERQLEVEILSDGGTIFRQPTSHAAILRGLIDIRAALKAAQMDVPLGMTLAISRMAPALRALRHGDGGLALFNGGGEGNIDEIDAILALSETKGAAAKRLPKMGYERLTAGRSLLLVDAGAPPPPPYDHAAHAGLLSFEFSYARERIIVNCGAGPSGDPEWRHAMGATAAHSTLALGNTNACEVFDDGGIGGRPECVTAQRFENDGQHAIEMAHDGYASRGRVMVYRTLTLSEDGQELAGRETVLGPKGKDFTVRWHLHPGVNALLAQDGGSVLMRLPSGAGWRFRVVSAQAGDLALESSIYCGTGIPRRTLQIRATGFMREEKTTLTWTLTREKTKKAVEK